MKFTKLIPFVAFTLVADAFEPVVGERCEKVFYAVDESEFGHGFPGGLTYIAPLRSLYIG